MKWRGGIPMLLALTLALFAVVVGLSSALLELSTVTRDEVRSTLEQAERAAHIVTSQLGATLAANPGLDPSRALATDPRLANVLRDTEQYTRAVVDVGVADSLGLVLVHGDSSRVGREAPARPQLVARVGFRGNLAQLRDILRESGTYEVQVPLQMNNRYFGSVRVGIAASLLREDLKRIFRAEASRVGVQVLLAMALGLALAWLLILNPLSRIEKGIQHLQAGDFSYRVPVAARRDELGKIATEINRLSESLARERENLLSERDNLVTEGTVLRHVLDAVDDGLVMMDAQGHIMLANRNATRLLGDDFARLSGRTLGELLSADHPLTALVRTAFEQGGKAASAQLDMPTPEGPRTFLASCQVVGEDTTQAGGILALRDFGRMREIQAIIDHARVLSRLGKMAAGVAHEIRNPLNAMNIHLELLRQNLGAAPGGANGAAQGIDRVAVVQREITRLERVVYGFLKLARLQELKMAPIEISAFLDDLKNLMLPEARLHGLNLQLDVAPDLPDIYGDEELLRQALLNLLRNAIQASPTGSPPIQMSARPEGGQVVLTVQDHGQGMTPEVQARIFDLYYTTKEEGTGVGLPLVQQTVEMHGGSLAVDSCPGAGATFTLRLPAYEPAWSA